MESLGGIAAYLWQRLPLILLFSGGYLLYRLMVVARLTDAFVRRALHRSRGSAAMLLLQVIVVSALLSSFMPNAVTMLTLLPVLKRLEKGFAAQDVPGMGTVLMCSGVYGVAIGGMGSMIGSPANAVLFAALDLFAVPGREAINFFNWFLWSVPLVILFVLAAWGVAAGLGLPRAARGAAVVLDPPEGERGMDGRQRYGVLLFGLYMGFWVLEAVAEQAVPGFAVPAPWVCLGFTGLFLYLLFIRPAPGAASGSGPLLGPADLITGVPRRGIVFLLALVALFGAIHWLGLDRRAVELIAPTLKGDMGPYTLFLSTVLAVIFFTELLSNTAVVAAFFTIAYAAAGAHGLNPLYLMIGVSLASTCAFMTPIATPTNALAFGEMRGVSLWRMLLLGLALNVIGAFILTGWLCWILPRIY